MKSLLHLCRFDTSSSSYQGTQSCFFNLHLERGARESIILRNINLKLYHLISILWISASVEKSIRLITSTILCNLEGFNFLETRTSGWLFTLWKKQEANTKEWSEKGKGWTIRCFREFLLCRTTSKREDELTTCPPIIGYPK